MPKIALNDVTKSFGAKQVLRGITMEVPAGKSVVVIGGSGTGKSVMLKCILGLLKPDSGSIKIDGVEITTLHPWQRESMMRKFGMLFQGGALFDSLPVWENVAFGLVQGKRASKRKAQPVAYDALAKVGLSPDVGLLNPSELSGGMLKRVALARAIASQPEIIFFDEPTTGLDPITADVINDLIVESVRNLGATALSITHDMASARKIADIIAMFHDGKIVWQGPASEIDNSGNELVDQFINGRAQGPIKVDVKRA